MINKVKDALKTKLTKLYPTYNIYLEDKPISEIVKPALRIIVEEKTSYNQRDIINQNVKLDIVSYLDESKRIEKYWDISDKLDRELGFLEIENTLIRTGEKVSKIIDKQLHYRFQIRLELVEQKVSGDVIQGIRNNIKLYK